MAEMPNDITIKIKSDKSFKTIWKYWQRRDRQRYFFLGWCAGVLTIILALWLAPYVDACDELPPPDETIKQIKVITV